MPNITGTLENWSISLVNNIYGPVYWGHIFGDIKGRFADGSFIHTSHVLKRKGKIIHTMNSVYRLGKKAKIEN